MPSRARATKSRRSYCLRTSHKIFGKRETMLSKRIMWRLNTMGNRNWAEFRKGKGISQNVIGNMLRPYGITSQSVRAEDDEGNEERGWGYKRRSFRDAWKRFLGVE
jgi:uncharacterized protein DUF3631